MLICAILFHNFKTEVRYQFEGFVLSIFCGDEGGGEGEYPLLLSKKLLEATWNVITSKPPLPVPEHMYQELKIREFFYHYFKA